MYELTVKTQQRDQMVEITSDVQRLVDQQALVDGYALVYVPHTTAGITINENADPDVVHDTLKRLDKMVPWREPFDRHGEGNSASHIKASMMGSSVYLIVHAGRLQLGRWQGIWFCEFDGPRTRSVWVSVKDER
ncbi:MAG: secondary thiamine-phosphate synthase enzyme YjbQ [Planctomycetota bacterium]